MTTKNQASGLTRIFNSLSLLSNRRSAVITLLAALCLFASIPQAWGEKYDEYYYGAQLTVTSHNSAEGIVHVSATSTTPSSGSSTSSLTIQDGNSYTSDKGGGDVSFYVYAIPADGYRFLGWSSSNTSYTPLSPSIEGDVYTIQAGTNSNTRISTKQAWCGEYNYRKRTSYFGSGTTYYVYVNSVTIYAWFEQIPVVDITFLAPSTVSENRGNYVVTIAGANTTVSTSDVPMSVNKAVTLTASPSEAYSFSHWYKQDALGNKTILSQENPLSDYNFDESVSVGAQFTVKPSHLDITFKAVDRDVDDKPVGSYTVNSTTVTTSDYVYNTGSATRFSPTLTATPATGYEFTGWYTKEGKRKIYLSTENPYNATFEEEISVYAEFSFNNYTDDQKAQFKVGANYYTDLNLANSAASSGSNKTIVCVRDGILPPGAYTISSGVTLYIPYSTSESVQTTPNVVTSTTALSAYRTLTFADGANIICYGNICVGGQIMSGGGGKPTGYPTGAQGVINMAQGGSIVLKNNATLYAWGYIKGQDIDQGNNTIGVGSIVAESGSTVWEDISFGDFRGGTACSVLVNTSGHRCFPFQSYSIQNIEVPMRLQFGASEKVYTNVYANKSTNEASTTLIASSGSLFLLQDEQSIVTKWYDPTTDLMCYELSGTAQINSLTVNIAGLVSVNSADYDLPITSGMHIIMSDCNMTLSKPMYLQPGSVVEIKESATVKLATNLYVCDNDEWGKFIITLYFKSFDNLTIHKNRGNGSSKELLDDAKLIVDGVLNITGNLYTSTGGADIMGNGGGRIVFPAGLPTGRNLYQLEGAAAGNSSSYDENKHYGGIFGIGAGDVYFKYVPTNAANMHNEDGSYTKSIGSKTFYNIHGRWFVADDRNEKENHAHWFTYIESGAVSGTSGTDTQTWAAYSWDKTGLELQQKWANINADACSDWWVGANDGYSYNWTLNSAWHQFISMPSPVGWYSGSDNTIYEKADCAWNPVGDTDENCLYTIAGVKKALVNGELIELLPNDDDPAYHLASDATKYYICFEGCNWHEATRIPGEKKAYVVEGGNYIWYDKHWLNVERETPFFYTLDETNVKEYYEYDITGDWVLSAPYVRVIDGLENRTFWFLDEAFAFASGAMRQSPTIKILRDYSRATTPVSYTGANKTCTLDLNGHTLELEVAGAGTSEVKMFTINAAGTTFTITDNTAEKKGVLRLIASVNTATSTKRWSGIYLQNGSLIMQNGTVHVNHPYTWVSNSNAGLISGILVASAKTFTMNGGTIYVEADYNPYGINAASGTPTVNINGGTIETVARAKDSPYAVFGYGTINVKGGTINAIAKASTSAMGVYVYGSSSYQGTANISGGTILARSTSSAQGARCWGSATVTADYNAETPDNTPKARYYAKLNITGGTITAECTTKATSYGVLSYGTTEISGGTITSTVQTSSQSDARGVCTMGGTTTIKSGANITANAPSSAYGLYCSGANGDSNRGWPHLGELIVEGGTITANTTNTKTAYGLLVTGATWTIAKTNSYSVFNGDYAAAGTAVVTGGNFYANAKTTIARGIAVAATQTKNAASATPKCTINGGYYKMTGTGDVLGCNDSAEPADFQINGGYYSHKGNLATYAVSPKQVVTLLQTDPNRPEYEYEVAEAYTVTFQNGETQLQSGYQEVGKSPVYEGDAPTKASTTTASYVFDGWSTTDGGALVSPLPALTSAGATYYAHFAETTLKYMATFDAKTNGGNEDAQVIYVEPAAGVGTLPTATKIGYTFNGWYTAASGGTKITSATVPTGDVTYFAQFTVNSHTLTWDLAGGTVSTAGKIGSTTWPAKNATGTPSRSVAYGTILTTIPVVTKTGYTFNRWNPVPTSSMPDEDVTYTALWNPKTNTAYTVKHYQQNTADDGYTLVDADTENYTGTTGENVTPTVKSYDGFISPMTKTAAILADGSLVVEYYYDRIEYTIKWDAYTNEGSCETNSSIVRHGATINPTPTATKNGYSMRGWFTKPAGGTQITAETPIMWNVGKLYAQFEMLVDCGEPLDIVDATDNTIETSLIINTNTNIFASSGWPYTINGTSYAKTDREADRTLVFTHTYEEGTSQQITVKNKYGVTVSSHTYTIPLVRDGALGSIPTLSGTDANSIVFVSENTILTVDADASAAAIYVSPTAELIINNGATLTVGKLVLRTSPSSSAILTNNGTLNATQTYYSRITRDQEFHLFAIPLASNTADVVLSDGSSCAVASTVMPYGNAWVMREYNAQRRADNGSTGENWDNIGWTGSAYADASVTASKAYEMRAGSKYYREYRFPVTLPTTTTSVSVTYATGSAGSLHAGWNILCSPYTHTYTINATDPATGIKVCWQQGDEWIEEQPSEIKPARPFAYQADAAGTLDFTTSTFTLRAPRHQSEMEAQTETEWLQLDLTDGNGLTDQTSVYVHPARFTAGYEAGIDLAKQSLASTRPILYTTHAYGDMAFAGVSDEALEQGIALTFNSPAAQTLTLSLRDNEWLNRMAYVWLLDNETGERTDLLMDDYRFTAPAGTIAGRLVLQGRFYAPQVATGLDETGVDYRIYNLNGNIAVSGVEAGTAVYVFDAVGHMLYHGTAEAEDILIPAPSAGVYMLHIGGKTAKMVINK